MICLSAVLNQSQNDILCVFLIITNNVLWNHLNWMWKKNQNKKSNNKTTTGKTTQNDPTEGNSQSSDTRKSMRTSPHSTVCLWARACVVIRLRLHSSKYLPKINTLQMNNHTSHCTQLHAHTNLMIIFVEWIRAMRLRNSDLTIDILYISFVSMLVGWHILARCHMYSACARHSKQIFLFACLFVCSPFFGRFSLLYLD